MNLSRLKFMVVGAACVLGLSSCNYNSLVDKQQSVDQSWAPCKATTVNIDVDDLNEETLARFQEAQNELTGALKSLLAVTEAYPDLKANENFRDLQVQLEGTENRITTARGRYTESVKDYNTSIKKFPTNIYAGWFGFDPKPQFKAAAGAEQAPTVQF